MATVMVSQIVLWGGGIEALLYLTFSLFSTTATVLLLSTTAALQARLSSLFR
jgi:hypothetical protein